MMAHTYNQGYLGIRGKSIQSKDSLSKIVRPILKNKQRKKAVGMAPVRQHLLIKGKVLSSTPRTAKKQNDNKKEHLY
jgi:hypothetical protein